MKTRLMEGLKQLELTLSDQQQHQLLRYIELLEKWNKVYNLTAVREPIAMLSQHLLDSLAMVNILATYADNRNPFSVLDVGSGPGLPAVPLAIAKPDWTITALDGHHKRTAFVQQVAIELKLKNLKIAQERVEQWAAPAPFDALISRAFAELKDFVELAQQHATPSGIIVAMKGVYPHEELKQLPETGWNIESIVPITVPFLEAQRHAVILKHTI